MHISSDAILFLPNHQRNLAVSFQTDQTIDHVASCLLQHPSPDNIVLLIKSGLQFYQNAYLLAILRRLSKGCNNGRITADTVECLFDGQNIRILGRLANKLYHRIKGLIRMVHQDISPAYLLEDITSGRQLRNLGRFIFRCLKGLKAFQPIQLHQDRQIQGTIDLIDILSVQTKLLFEDL